MAQAHPIANTEPKETSFDRRAFLKSTAIGAAGLGTMTSMLGRVPQASAEEAQSSSPEAPGTEMTLEELNAFRKDLVDKQTDYTCADGTVIPAVYVKLRALINSYSFGFGSEVHDHCFDEFIYLFTEDEAQAYLEMPYGVEFTATDFAVSSGRSEEECHALCEDLASRAVLRRVRRGGVPYYHHVAMAYGLWEYRVCGDDSNEYVAAHSAVWGEDAPDNKMGSYTPFYYTVPVHRDVVNEDDIYPYDDYEKILERNSVFGIAACQCQKLFTATGEIPESDVLMERCIVLGANAEYCIESGFAREASKDEVLNLIRDCVDQGWSLRRSGPRSLRSSAYVTKTYAEFYPHIKLWVTNSLNTTLSDM